MWLSGKESTCQYRRHKRRKLDPWVGKIPWRRKWQLIPVFLPGKVHGQRSLSGYSPWGCKESDTTEPTFQKCGPSSFLTWLPYGQTQPSNWTELNWWSENAVSAFSFKLAETSFMALYMDRLCQHFECAWEECSFLILITGYGTFYVGIQSRL